MNPIDNFSVFYAQNAPTNEGLLSRALGTAALAGALGISSPSEAGQANVHRKSMTAMELQNIKQRIQLNIIARTLWAEARGGGEAGMRGVASVIYNRGEGNIEKMIAAIKKPKQFSCWNAMTVEDWTHFKEKVYNGKEWDIANRIALEMLRGKFIPITPANHYYNPQKVRPSWAYQPNGNLRPNDDIGIHRFMKLDDPSVQG